MSDLIPFAYNNYSIRTMQHEDGSTWWVATELCAAVHIRNVSQACARLDDDEKDTICFTDSEGRPHELLIISESGLYKLLMRSNKDEAKLFQRWVTREVLPQIRKTGSYGQTTQPAVQNQALQAIIDMAVQLDRTEQRAILAEATATRAESKADMALETQQFLTIAEYVHVNHLRSQLPESAYRAASDHLRLYCDDHIIPYRRIPVGGKRWSDEYAFHIHVYAEAFSPWLRRRNAQAYLRVITPTDTDASHA